MKEALEYYYNLILEDLNEDNGNTYFYFNKMLFYFVFLNRREDELEDIISSSREIRIKGISCHYIIINKFGKVVSYISDKPYILLKIIPSYKEEVDIFEIIENSKKLNLTGNKSRLYRNNWVDLWSQKVDYFEYQIKNYGKKKLAVLNSFSYFLGLAENAIVYASNTVKQLPSDNRITLCHRRIFSPNYQLNYYNPLAFIIDLEVRDIAEYFKAAFFKKEDINIEIDAYLKVANLSRYSAQMLFARLMFPSYYFDVYERLINQTKEEEENLIRIIDKVDDYEKFLETMYYKISQYIPIEKVDWLLKNK